MSDRYHSLTVVLSKDHSEEFVQDLRRAISMLHGVLSVEMNVADVSSLMAEDRARRELADKLWNVLYPKEVGHAR